MIHKKKNENIVRQTNRQIDRQLVSQIDTHMLLKTEKHWESDSVPAVHLLDFQGGAPTTKRLFYNQSQIQDKPDIANINQLCILITWKITIFFLKKSKWFIIFPGFSWCYRRVESQIRFQFPKQIHGAAPLATKVAQERVASARPTHDML